MKQSINYLQHIFSIILLSGLSSTLLFAQPANDTCTNAIQIEDLDNFCSAEGAYNNDNATATPWNSGGDLSTDGQDVWFRFVATASRVNITVRGLGTGGSLQSPEIQLLADNNCGDSFVILGNQLSNFSDITELNKGGLIPGASYLIRVQGAGGAEGSFQLCVNNFSPPQMPGSDIEVAAMLCDKSPFVLEQVLGGGIDDNEAIGTCLDVGGIFGGLFGIASEQNSTWFTWVAANNGILEFTLDPLNPTDDLDFVIYELPNGVNNGEGKIAVRCMATACEGPTGLSASSIDFEEDADCDFGEDGFVKALQLEEGKAYGLLINNFSESGNGFSMEFGGDGEFQGPVPNITKSTDGTLCLGESITFDASASSFAQGSIVEYEWVFGVGATPATATGVTPEAVTYTEAGEKTVVLTITTASGCKVTTVEESFFTVSECCLDVDIISDATQVELGNDLILETNVTDAIGDVSYEWTPSDILSCSDCPMPTATPEENTTIYVNVMDANGCESTDSIAIEVEIIIEEIAIPNAFTPDFDGTNDRFTILGGGPEDRIVSLQVYTRWGTLVYETANIPLGNENGAGWDGNYKGKRMQPDVFIYHAVVLAEGEEIAFTGDLTLIR